MKVLLTLVLAIHLSGCWKTEPCSKIKPYSDKAAVAFASALDCKRPDLMKVEFLGWLEAKGQCRPEVKVNGLYATILCPIVVPMMVKVSVDSLPPAWECSGKPATAALTSFCFMIPY